ncbi:MAG: HAMP domain-containing histidine kinase [Chloroflexi bacterium]|nr:HAMP domain-containing histidine kinase [Chloroflexota bacterium]
MFKLIAAFLGVSLVAIALVALFGWLSAANEFNRFISQEAENNFVVFVTEYYNAHGNLTDIEDAMRTRFDNRNQNNPDPPRLAPFGLADAQGIIVLRGDSYTLGETAPPALFASGTRILVNGKVVGVVLPWTRPAPRNRSQEQYLQRTGMTLALAAGGAALFAIVLGVLLARTITQPVRELTRAAQRTAKGELGQTVRVQSRDEVGELATAFNQMSADLKRADESRRQMTADIAHELRNPLTVIGGYLDAMRLGDLQPTPPRLGAVYDEIQHLEAIVDDLRTLSLADAGALVLNRQSVAVNELLARIAARHAPQAAQRRIQLRVEPEAHAAAVEVDEARFTQVLDNLVNNALHHTHAGGAVLLSAETRAAATLVRVADTGEGIAPADLPRVFERFYRGDKTRPAEHGSSGLGLAIAKALVEAHGGKIWAESELGHGATLIIELPRAPEQPPPREDSPAVKPLNLQTAAKFSRTEIHTCCVNDAAGFFVGV